MHCCDGNKKLPDEDSLINASDYLPWFNINGAFGLYSGADFGMDTQISAFDKLVWTSNQWQIFSDWETMTPKIQRFIIHKKNAKFYPSDK